MDLFKDTFKIKPVYEIGLFIYNKCILHVLFLKELGEKRKIRKIDEDYIVTTLCIVTFNIGIGF